MRMRWASAAVLVGLAAAIGCGSKSATCTTGAEGCACFANDTCFTGLTCASHLCVDIGGSGGAGRGGGTGQGGTIGAGGQAGGATGGTSGAAGTIGIAGTSGSAGTTGAAGTSGSAGTAGAAGTTGAAGAAGTTGAAGTSGSGGATGAAGSGGRGGAGGAAGAAGTGSGGMTGGSGGSSSTSGCPMSDPPPSAIIADFATMDGGAPVLPFGETFFYAYPAGSGGGPTATVVNGAWHITATTTGMASAQYWGVGISFDGNVAGTNCIDATPFNNVQFDISGTITGTGCSAQYALSDSAHLDNAVDAKGSGDATVYAPQAALTVTAAVQTVTMPFAGAGAPTGGSPAVAVDDAKLTRVQWQFTTAPGATSSCRVDVTIDNVKFSY
jgi:hypothetical protein